MDVGRFEGVFPGVYHEAKLPLYRHRRHSTSPGAVTFATPPQRIECIILRHTPESLGRLRHQNVGRTGIGSLFVLVRANGGLVDGLVGRGQCPNLINFLPPHRPAALLPPDPRSAPFPAQRLLEVLLLTIPTPFLFLTGLRYVRPPQPAARRNGQPPVAVSVNDPTESAIHHYTSFVY